MEIKSSSRWNALTLAKYHSAVIKQMSNELDSNNMTHVYHGIVIQWSSVFIFVYVCTVVGSILADATAFTDFVPFSKVLRPTCLFRTHGCAEAFIL